MSDSKPGPIRRFFVGIWNTLNFTRRLVFNLLFVVLLVFFIVVLFSGPGVKPVANKSALVLNLSGALVEQYGAHPVDRVLNQAMGQGRAEVQLRDILRAIELAREDKRIDRIVLLTDGFSASGFAAMRDVTAALREFRAAGKQVVAYGTGMDPQGGVLLEGLGRYRMYYREGLQDKLGVDVHLFKVGEYKSAAEPYVLDAASPEAKEADLYWMNDLWDRYVADIAAARGLEPSDIDAMIAELPQRVQAVGGDLGKLAVDEKLVDGLRTREEMKEMLVARGALDEEEDTFQQVDMRSYLRQQSLTHLSLDGRPQVAVVVAQGPITDGEQAPGTVGGESTSELLRQAREDEDVKAVLLRVDSPGGGVFPSEQIRREVELIQAEGKPVVVSMGNVAASGGYWISMNADRIYADESTITGSIGIFGLWMTAPRVLDKLGVNTDGVGTTELAGAFDPTRPMDPNVGVIIQSVINRGYADFIGKVADARDSTPAQIDVHARGRVWSGAQAKERGLVDELGGREAALAEAAKLAKLEEGKYGVRYVEKPLTPFEKFLVDVGDQARFQGAMRLLAPAALGLDRETTMRIGNELGWLESQSNTPYRAVAHCLCAL